MKSRMILMKAILVFVIFISLACGFLPSDQLSKDNTGQLYAEILQEDGAVYSGDQSVVIDGEAYTDSESLLDEEVTFTWSSNVDGLIVEGAGLFVNAQDLSEGEHIITLTTQDDNGRIGTDMVTIEIFREFSSLSTDIETLEFSVKAGDAVTMEQTVEVWHLGNHSIIWSVEANQPWIVVEQVDMETPSYFLVRVEPSNLPSGTYAGRIIITSNAEGASTHEIKVLLVVE